MTELWRHYKGEIYKVIRWNVTHTETNETFVYYENKNGRPFIRPQEMFLSDVIHEGRKMKRFERIN